MEVKIQKQTIKNLLDDIASSEPTPGGGAVAALVGALAAALCEMVAELTKGNKDIKILRYRVKNHRNKLLGLADEDSRAFEKVMQAYRIEKSAKSREKKIQAALKRATEIPLATAQSVAEIEKIAVELIKIGNKNAISDSKTALYLTKAAYLAALENVRINLDRITDQTWKKKILLRVLK